PKKFKDLPFASSLCGSCTDVCPVKIDIDKQLYRWRQDISEKHLQPIGKSYIMKIAGIILVNHKMYEFVGKMVRWSIKNLPRFLIYNKLNIWGYHRELPAPPEKSFKQWYRDNE